eukprot:COSAG02_NODE_29181_length_574_cov_1.044211_1_plen_68_part_00
MCDFSGPRLSASPQRIGACIGLQYWLKQISPPDCAITVALHYSEVDFAAMDVRGVGEVQIFPRQNAC